MSTIAVKKLVLVKKLFCSPPGCTDVGVRCNILTFKPAKPAQKPNTPTISVQKCTKQELSIFISNSGDWLYHVLGSPFMAELFYRIINIQATIIGSTAHPFKEADALKRGEHSSSENQVGLFDRTIESTQSTSNSGEWRRILNLVSKITTRLRQFDSHAAGEHCEDQIWV